MPAADLAGRARGIDLRQHGSGNLGTTNVFRALGWQLGLLVFVVDALKGALPVWLLPDVTSSAQPQLWAIAFGVAAIAGHVKPIFLMGKGGGKGVATASGVFAALAPLAIGSVSLLFVLLVATTGYVSLGLLVGAAVLPLAIWITQGLTPVFWISLPLGAFVFWSHRGNIGRLLRGEESSFRNRPATGGDGPASSAGAPPAGGV